MHAGRVDPAVIEIKQSADRDGAVNLRVGPAHVVKRLHVIGRDMNRVAIHFADEPEEPFLLFSERRILEIAEDTPHEIFASEQFRRNCGMRLQSKRAVILVRGIRRDELADARR
jgi:hypothetical protein